MTTANEGIVLKKLNLKEIWDDAYYAGKRVMSDATYDLNKDEISLILERTPDLKAKYWDRFTRTSYSRLENTFGDVKHEFPMTSLDKTNKIDKFMERIAKWREAGSKHAVLMWKVDGSSSAYRYRGRTLDQCLTRHTGEFGKDVTITCYRIENLPKTVNADFDFEVRGEMVIYEKDFPALNELRVANGQDPYANLRNATAGISQTKEADRIKGLSSIAYDVNSRDHEWKAHTEKLEFLKDNGFNVVEYQTFPTDIERADLVMLFAVYEERRFDLGYEVDGLVAMVDELDVREELGHSSNTPDYAYAFKFKDIEIEFEIDDSVFENGIEWSFGQTGVITPRAHFKENPRSSEILGVSITHSTLHNLAELRRIGWKVGSTHAIVKRAGLVIPKVVEAIGAKIHETEYPQPPGNCPHCGGVTGFMTGGEIFGCMNDECEGKSFNRIMRFIRSMEIEEIGETTLSKIVEDGLASGPQDLYALTVDQLVNLERLGKSVATKIVKNIQNSKKQPLWRVLDGLMIRGLGSTTSKSVATVWPTLEIFKNNVSYQDLCGVDGIGPTSAKSIMNGLGREEMDTIIGCLIQLGVGMTVVEKVVIEGPLKDMTFCLTGSPELDGEKVKKANVEAMIVDAGGTIASMGKGLTYLVAGPDSIAEGSNKLEKAKKQGTKVITADELVALIGGAA